MGSGFFHMENSVVCCFALKNIIPKKKNSEIMFSFDVGWHPFLIIRGCVTVVARLNVILVGVAAYAYDT